MCAHDCAIDKGLPVMKKTVGVGGSIIINMNKHLISENTPDGFENCALLTALRQAMGRGCEIGSSIWHTYSWNEDTEMWVIEWPEEKNWD
eukprot:2973202-Ditylum_brightwellii.AAC.1